MLRLHVLVSDPVRLVAHCKLARLLSLNLLFSWLCCYCMESVTKHDRLFCTTNLSITILPSLSVALLPLYLCSFTAYGTTLTSGNTRRSSNSGARGLPAPHPIHARPRVSWADSRAINTPALTPITGRASAFSRPGHKSYMDGGVLVRDPQVK